MRIAPCLVGCVIALGPMSLYAQERPPIIDVHMHAYSTMPTDGSARYRLCFPSSCTPEPAVAEPGADLIAMTLQMMDRYNIIHGYLSGGRQQLERWVAAAPGRFTVGPVIFDPAMVDLPALRELYASGFLTGMGELAFEYRGIMATDSLADPLFALASEFDVPTLIHLEGIGGGGPRFRITAGHPEQLEDVLKRHPDLRIYLENAGYPYLEEMISLMYMYPQVHADLSTITWVIPRPEFYRYLRTLVDAGLSDRLMWGSDQMYWPETIGLGIEAIESAPFLTPAQKRDILYNNAKRFLRLEGN